MSGLSVLEIELPTGYNLLESEAEKLVQSGVHPTLRDARTVEGKTFWFFDHVSFSLQFHIHIYCNFQRSMYIDMEFIIIYT
jgi:hypothetical protein